MAAAIQAVPGASADGVASVMHVAADRVRFAWTAEAARKRADAVVREYAAALLAEGDRMTKAISEDERAARALRHSSFIRDSVSDLATDAQWVRELLYRTDSDKFKRVWASFEVADVACTHTGLIFYLYACWARERGTVLRPDMLWNTILREEGNNILDHPDMYQHIFTQEDGKQTIIIRMDAPSRMNVELLAAAVRKQMPEEGFADLVLGQPFVSAHPLAQYASAATLCDMGAPFFDYMGTFCGIPSVDIVGPRSDWEMLMRAVERLSSFQPRMADAKSGRAGGIASARVDKERELKEHREKQERFVALRTDWLSRCASIVRHIISWAFDATNDAARTAFFADMFHYGINYVCGSGHATGVVKGWAKEFYMKEHDEIIKYPTHVSTIPYQHIDSKRRYVQAVALAYSLPVGDGTVWEAQYGVATYEMENEQ